MSTQIDHRKASKRAKINKNGAELIDPGDRTLSASGYPSAQDMARSPPKKRPRGFETTPLVYKKETIEEARAAIIRARREKADIWAGQNGSPKPTNTKPPTSADSEAAEPTAKEAREKIGQKNRKLVSEQYLGLAASAAPAENSGLIVEGTDKRSVLTVVQTLPRGRKRTQQVERVVQVEIKPVGRPFSPDRGKNQGSAS